MIVTDPIADMLTRIRNALAVGKTSVTLPHSTLKLSLAEQLQKSGYIESVKENGEGVSKSIELKLCEDGVPSKITKIERLSKPGRRLYAKADNIPRVLSGRGVMILSTSKGLMTDSEARSVGIGGELICKVY